MMNFKKLMLATAAAGSLTLATGAAQAVTVLDDWDLNLSVANGLGGFAGLSNVTGIDHGILQGISTVTQTVVGGVALGQSFTDDGSLALTGVVKEGQVLSTPINPSLGNAAALYFEFVGLTGTLNADSTITFNPGSGSIRLVLDSDTDLNTATGSVLTLATFELLAPSGGNNLDFFGGTAANSTIDVTLKQLTGLAGLFTDENGNELQFIETLHLGNVDALLDPNYNPNPDNSGIDQFGNGVSVIHVQNGGQYNVAAVPEPGTMAALGLGLVMMGAVSYRRRKAA